MCTRVLFSFLTLLLLSYTATAQNLIVNGGFETATAPVPEGTSVYPYPTELNHFTEVNVDGEFIYDAAKAHSGTGFLSLLQNAGQNPLSAWLGKSSETLGYDRAGQIIAVEPNTPYRLSFWYKHGDGSRYGYGAGDVWLNIEHTLPGHSSLYTQQFPAAGEWKQYNGTFITGPNTHEIIVLFSGAGKENVDIWIDDIEMYNLSRKPSGNPQTQSDTLLTADVVRESPANTTTEEEVNRDGTTTTAQDSPVITQTETATSEIPADHSQTEVKRAAETTFILLEKLFAAPQGSRSGGSVPVR